jgi:hypothetical protein
MTALNDQDIFKSSSSTNVFCGQQSQGWNLFSGRFCIVTYSMVSQLQSFLIRWLMTGCKQKHVTRSGFIVNRNGTNPLRTNACRQCTWERLTSLLLVKTAHTWSIAMEWRKKRIKISNGSLQMRKYISGAVWLPPGWLHTVQMTQELRQRIIASSINMNSDTYTNWGLKFYICQ